MGSAGRVPVHPRISCAEAPRNGGLPGQQLVSQDSNSIDIHSVVEMRVRHRLLRRHVRGCSQRDAGFGKPVALRGIAYRLGDAKIHDQRVTAGQENVVRLDVAMHHAPAVRVGQGVHDFGQNPYRVLDGQFPAPEPIPQRFSLHERHDVVGATSRISRPLFEGPRIEQWQDMWVLQPGGDSISRKNRSPPMAAASSGL